MDFGQAHPVETPVANPTEIVLAKHSVIFVGKVLHPVPISGELLRQIESDHSGFFAGLAVAEPASPNNTLEGVSMAAPVKDRSRTAATVLASGHTATGSVG